MTIPVPINRWSGVHKFGSNLDIDTATTPEDVWDYGGAYPFPAAAAATTIVSDEAADDGAPVGTGARTVRVYGVDANYTAIDEVITMNGTSAVTLANEYLRVFRMKVLTAGTDTTNKGTILVKHGATVIAQIAANEGQTLMAIYTIPADYAEMFLVKWYVTCGKAVTTIATVVMQMREYGGAWQTKEKITISNTTGDWQYTFPRPIAVDAKTDIRVRVTNVTANNTSINAGFDLVY